MTMLTKLFGFLRLYHPHAVVLYPFSYLLGAYMAAGASALNGFNLLVAALLGGISLNFVYVLNSWFDAEIDSINKPRRPIPSGVITKKEAWNYALILLALAVIYPFVLFGFSPTAFLFLWFPAAGILYSNRWYPFKKRKVLALALITSTILYAAALGYFLSGGENSAQAATLAFMLIATCLAAIPLKDLSDVKGDAAHGSGNWFSNGRYAPKFAFSGGMLVSACILALASGNLFLGSITLLNLVGFLVLLGLSRSRRFPMRRFYINFILVISLGALLLAALYVSSHAGITS